ncbi:MAG TPA: hypothetical protein VKM55_03220 [Candidatus Lokiarchaeia archaeon]|nr:hypothetical protein [Candidatus Lokiarchaeia archaeon]
MKKNNDLSTCHRAIKNFGNLLKITQTDARTETWRKNPSTNHEFLKNRFPFHACSSVHYYERGHDYRVADRRCDGCCKNIKSHSWIALELWNNWVNMSNKTLISLCIGKIELDTLKSNRESRVLVIRCHF